MTAYPSTTRTFGRRQIKLRPIVPHEVGVAMERAPRKDVRLPAQLTAEYLHGSLACSVVNISSSGALLRLPFDLSSSNIYLPEKVRLRLSSERREVDCRIVYQDGLKIGVCFLAPFSPSSR